jgi:ABC-type multidrug transport system ATPase subunit/pSer/pThr/pTyr-binding forkhead associated (FHA) protein
MRLRGRLVRPTGEGSPVAAAGDSVRLGRDPTCELPIDPGLFPKVSRVHARIEPGRGGFVLVPLSQSNETLLNDKPLDGPMPVRPGDRIRLGFTGPTVELDALEPAAGPAEDSFGRTVLASAEQLALLRGSAGLGRYDVGTGGVIGREKGRCHVLLDHPHVSRLHAALTVHDGKVTLSDLGSANGTFVNGRRLTRRVVLAPGDRIDVGPFALEFDGTALVGASRANNIELVARGVSRVVRDRATGQPLTLLDAVTLVVKPREFVCLLGPSGSGKSTLLGTLSGRAVPDGGSVAVNGRDLHAHFAALKQDIAVVPQRDALHETLPVGAALGYTAELRLPPDTDRTDVESAVGDVLGVVGLADRRGALIRNLSGGQLKRASLANELLCKPTLLFLDEVTSGLDERTDREMMELFRLLADGGKTVVCVTHSLANVEASCHLVVILAAGGKLAFVGTPDEAKGYFGVARLGDVYRRLAGRPAEDWRSAFRASPYFARYVRDRLPPGTGGAATVVAPAADPPAPASPLRQAWVLTRRYAAVWRGDLPALAALLGQSLLVAALMAAVFGRLDDVPGPAERAGRAVNVLFLLAVSSFWLGCNNAAKELVKERLIYARERAFNLRADSYFASKLVVLAAVNLVQVGLLFAVVRLWCGPPGNPLLQFGLALLLAFAGTALGLLISAAARTEEAAIALVPVAVIPQIILSGVIAPLAGGVKLVAEGLVSVYWGQRGLQDLLPEADRAVLGFGDEPAAVPALVIAGHAVVCSVGALVLLSRTGRGRPS